MSYWHRIGAEYRAAREARKGGKAPTLDEVQAKRRPIVARWGVLPYQLRPIRDAWKASEGKSAKIRAQEVVWVARQNFPFLGRDLVELSAKVSAFANQWWDRVVIGVDPPPHQCRHETGNAWTCTMSQPDGATGGKVCPCACHATIARAVSSTIAAFEDGRAEVEAAARRDAAPPD